MNNIQKAIHDLQQGKMIILTDNSKRENEGDLIFPAETITPEVINFMIRHGTGIVCLTLPEEHLAKLNSPLLVPPQNNNTQHGTPFTLPLDAATGITTGVSAADRAHTIRVIMQDNVQAENLVRPGHIFPLQAKKGGVLERAGHTEGSLDIVHLAGFKPAAVICEIMNPDGSMARDQDLVEFAKQHDLTILAIDELIEYRLQHEAHISEVTTANLPLQNYGEFKIMVFKDKYSQQEQTVLLKEPYDIQKPVLVRMHSSCLTGDIFGSMRCDCHQQLHFALDKISQEGGVLIYLNQEGRGIGLFNKIRSYALQERGLDTVQANHELGFHEDLRDYSFAVQILKHLHIDKIELFTNNPAKINALQKAGLSVSRRAIEVLPSKNNKQYLKVKRDKLGHLLNLVGDHDENS